MDIIRDNRNFDSVEELKSQIQKDVNHVRAHWQSILDLPELKKEEKRQKDRM